MYIVAGCGQMHVWMSALHVRGWCLFQLLELHVNVCDSETHERLGYVYCMCVNYGRPVLIGSILVSSLGEHFPYSYMGSRGWLTHPHVHVCCTCVSHTTQKQYHTIYSIMITYTHTCMITYNIYTCTCAYIYIHVCSSLVTCS